MKHNPFFYWAWRKVHRYREDAVIGISGATGLGKTTLSVRLAELLDRDTNGRSRFPAYEYETKIVDGVKTKQKNLVPRLVNSIDDYKELRKKTNYPAGTAFIIDEAQTLVNSRDFMTRKNKDVIRLISTGRVFRSFTFLNLPYWEHLDNQIKTYLHAVIIVSRPDHQKGISVWTPYLIKPMGYGKPPFMMKFRRRDALTGRLYVTTVCHSRLPSKELHLAQQEKTNSWKEKVHQGLIGSDGSLLKPKVEKAPARTVRKEEAARISSEVFEKIKPMMEKFRVGSHFSVSKIRAHTGESRMICEMVSMKFMDYQEKLEKNNLK